MKLRAALDFFCLAVVFHDAVLVVLASDVIISVDASGFGRPGDERPIGARFFGARAVLFAGTIFIGTIFVGASLASAELGADFARLSHAAVPLRFYARAFVHEMAFAADALGIEVNLRRNQGSASALIPDGNSPNGAGRSLNLGQS